MDFQLMLESMFSPITNKSHFLSGPLRKNSTWSKHFANKL